MLFPLFFSLKQNKSLFLRQIIQHTIFTMKKYTYTEKKDTRSGFGDGLTELGRTNPNVVALCADLVGSLKMGDFIKENPERFFQIGIAEANMIGIAAGMTIGGKMFLQEIRKLQRCSSSMPTKKTTLIILT